MGLKRIIATCLGGPAAALALTAPAHAAAILAAPSPAPPGPATLSGFRCVRAIDPPLRGIDVTAVMRPIPSTQHLALRFDLLRAARRHGHYRVVHGPNLATWISPPDPSLGQHPADVWRLSHPVAGLPAPAYYRLRVSFRWIEMRGRVLAQVVRQTPLCHQLELRPDLAVGAVGVQALSARPGYDAYTATIRNRGASPAGPFDVALTIAGTAQPAHTVALLRARHTRQVRFVAPACTAGDRVSVAADSAGTVEDLDRSNNVLTVSCPAPG